MFFKFNPVMEVRTPPYAKLIFWSTMNSIIFFVEEPEVQIFFLDLCNIGIGILYCMVYKLSTLHMDCYLQEAIF